MLHRSSECNNLACRIQLELYAVGFGWALRIPLHCNVLVLRITRAKPISTFRTAEAKRAASTFDARHGGVGQRIFTCRAAEVEGAAAEVEGAAAEVEGAASTFDARHGDVEPRSPLESNLRARCSYS